MPPTCAVCDSPTAFTMHFGGRCCKACAAFFRRTVALSLKYECASNQCCEINFGMRLVCRSCRLQKCFHAGMKADLVRSKRENFSAKGRKHSDGSSNDRQESSTSVSPNLRDDDDWQCPMLNEASTNYMPQFEASPDASSRQSSFDAVYNTPTTSYAIPPPPPSQATPIPQPIYDSSFDLLNHYVSLETSLSSRRRIMYTNTEMDSILECHSNLECPYLPSDLRPHDYRTFRGMLRHDFVILFDYCTGFPQFNSFNSNEKNVFYRFIVAVDFIVSSAFYSSRLGTSMDKMIFPNGEFLCMSPMPMTGEEANARSFFDSDDDFSKYRALMPMHTRIWEESIVPFSRLQTSFQEYVLIKALTVWHITYYKMSECGREKCRVQRDLIISCLSRVCTYDDVQKRVGELLMSMTYIMESVQKLTSSYVLLTFFDVLKCDSMLHEMLTFKY
ncbi:unnamed protein product [Caenorhabditis bovis]|uniref:Uncharacterized protein n=1 Tax=Caenorhabditis bovis TaxID=2654633 RepID=A0A8S1EW81_9PELO|nr:unnamed protein product [Caenorhabditis bovis]